MGRTVSFIVFSSAALLFMPIMIETERLQIQDQQKAQKTQMLLGAGKSQKSLVKEHYRETSCRCGYQWGSLYRSSPDLSLVMVLVF